jgi:hypothetical protein
MKTRKKLGVVAGWLLLLLLPGCLGEDNSLCPDDSAVFRLAFTYADGQGGDLFAEHIGSVDVFIYGSDSRLVLRTHVDGASLASYRGTQLELPPGNYRVVCWGNAGAQTAYTGVETGDLFSGAHIGPVSVKAAGTATDGDPLFYGPGTAQGPVTAGQEITVPAGVDGSAVVNFCTAYIRLEVYIRGAGGAAPVVSFTPVPATYGFDGTAGAQGMTYTKPSSFETIDGRKTAVAVFYAPLFAPDTDIRLLVSDPDGGATLTEIPLADYIRENGITLDGITPAVVPILLTYFSGDVAITLPDWETAPATPEL